MIKLIDIRNLKDRAITFPEPARSLILTESEQMPLDEFITKLGTWEKLLQLKRVVD